MYSPRSGEHAQSVLLHDAEQLQRRAAGSFGTALPLLHGRLAGVEVTGEHRLADKGYDSNAIRAKAAERKAGPIFRRRPTAGAASPSPAASIGSGTSSNGSSTVSNSSAVSPRATTSDRRTISPPSNSSQQGTAAAAYESTA
jgi:hypothetical protein